jgi:hypothetical protein
VAAALTAHRDYLMTETLASEWRMPGQGAFTVQQDDGDAKWTIHLARDSSAS